MTCFLHFLVERKDANLHDLEVVFELLGVQICELEDYVHQVEPIHLSRILPQYPVSCKPHIKFATLEEISSRDECYDEHLPPMDVIAKETATEEPDAGIIYLPGLFVSRERSLAIASALAQTKPRELLIARTKR